MTTIVSDAQIVGDTVSTLFSIVQQSPISASLLIKNSGVNTMNYRFQGFSGSAWVDLGASGSDYYTTLSPNEVKLITLSPAVTLSYPQLQMVGNASGGAYLEFSLMRYANRASGASLPLLSL